MTSKVSGAKVRVAFLAIVLSAIVSYFGQPLIHQNDGATNVIVTVFSVLAGFLVAIIAIVGDPVLLPPGTWRAAELEREKLDHRLVRHKWLFIGYLLTLAVIFIALLVSKTFPVWGVWFERLFLFLATFSFLLSLQLPSALMQVQRERIDAVIEHRRTLDGIKNNDVD